MKERTAANRGMSRGERGRYVVRCLGFTLLVILIVHYPPHALGRLAMKMTGGISALRTPSSFVHLTEIVNCIFVWFMAALGTLTGWWAGSNSESAS
jgi:hypothetical protein